MMKIWHTHKRKIKIIAFLLGLYLLFYNKSCSCYKIGLEYKDGTQYMFTKPNVDGLYRAYEFLYESLFGGPEDEAPSKKFKKAIQVLDPVEQALVKKKIKETREKKPVFTSSVSVQNLTKKGKGDRDAEKIKKRIHKIRKLKEKEKEIAKKFQGNPPAEEKAKKDETELKKIEKEIAEIKKEITKDTPEIKENIETIVKEKTEEKPKEEEKEKVKKTYKTLEFEISERRRLFGGKCFEENPCFNGPGKDYNFMKVPGRDMYYFLSDRVDPKIKPTGNKIGGFSLFVVDAKPTSNLYEPIFENPRKIKLSGISGSILGFTLYQVGESTKLIFSYRRKLYEATTKDGYEFSNPAILPVQGRYLLRDPSVSPDGKTLVYSEENKSKWETWVTIAERDSVNHGFSRFRRIDSSTQTSGSGAFPSIYVKGGRRFIFYRVFEKMFSVEVNSEDIFPAVEVSGVLPEKYITFLNIGGKTILFGSMLTKKNSYDLARFKIHASPVTKAILVEQ